MNETNERDVNTWGLGAASEGALPEGGGRPRIGKRISRTLLEPTSLTTPELRAIDRFIDLVAVGVGDDLAAIWLYGSRARGESASEDSDVDLLVLACGEESGIVAPSSRLRWKPNESLAINNT